MHSSDQRLGRADLSDRVFFSPVQKAYPVDRHTNAFLPSFFSRPRGSVSKTAVIAQFDYRLVAVYDRNIITEKISPQFYMRVFPVPLAAVNIYALPSKAIDAPCITNLL